MTLLTVIVFTPITYSEIIVACCFANMSRKFLDDFNGKFEARSEAHSERREWKEDARSSGLEESQEVVHGLFRIETDWCRDISKTFRCFVMKNSADQTKIQEVFH